MAQCPKCNGSGRVSSHLNPYDANKVGAGMGMHRCDRCAGQGVVHGASGAGGGQQLGNGLMAIVTALFLHPVFSFVGFWLISTGLSLWLGYVVSVDVLGLDTNNDPPIWIIILMFGIPVLLTVFLRKIVPTIMKWIFYIAIGGITLAFVGGIIWKIIEKTSSS